MLSSLIHSFKEYQLSIYYVPGSLLGVKDILVNKTKSFSDEFYSLEKGSR